jgi:hypothetical protein
MRFARAWPVLENIRLGDGLGPGTKVGPLIGKADVARVDGVVEAAVASAKPVVRGGPATAGPLGSRPLSRPALLEVEDVTTDTVQKEVFGPVGTFEISTPTRSPAPTRPNTASRPASSSTTSTSAAGSAARSTPAPSGPTPGRRSTTPSPRAVSSGAASATGTPLAITEFQKAKTVVHSIPPLQD